MISPIVPDGYFLNLLGAFYEKDNDASISKVILLRYCVCLSESRHLIVKNTYFLEHDCDNNSELICVLFILITIVSKVVDPMTGPGLVRISQYWGVVINFIGRITSFSLMDRQKIFKNFLGKKRKLQILEIRGDPYSHQLG